MSHFFVDTSALFKRYRVETGSTWVKSWIPASTDNSVVISDTALVEVYSTLNRLMLEKKIAYSDVMLLYNSFIVDAANEYFLIPLDRSIYSQATTLIKKHSRLRTLDSIQLACAVKARQFFKFPLHLFQRTKLC